MRLRLLERAGNKSVSILLALLPFHVEGNLTQPTDSFGSGADPIRKAPVVYGFDL